MAKDDKKLEPGFLSDEQKKSLSDWLIKKSGNPVRPCPVCNVSKWEIGDQVIASPRYADDGLKFGGAVYPVIPVTCLNCGNTHYINAVVSRVLPPDEPEAKS